MLGRLDLVPALDAPELLAPAFLAALQSWPRAAEVQVAAIDADLADTAAFCSAYDIGPDVSANCVVVVGRRGDAVRRAACVVLATTRVDVNGVVRRQLDVRKASFGPREETTDATGMEYGGITPIGLPDDWPVLLEAAVLTCRSSSSAAGCGGRSSSSPGRHWPSCPAPRC